MYIVTNSTSNWYLNFVYIIENIVAFPHSNKKSVTECNGAFVFSEEQISVFKI
jgi:mannitol/fructose-specific phosphotransferase system IIA component (Ntr-type)